MNLITYLIDNKLAKNEPHARAKIALLHLQDICNDEAAVIARVKLYEAHKTSKLHGKNDRAICAEMAIKGKPVPAPVVDMFVPELPMDEKYPYITDGKKICVICETTHESNEIVKLASGVDADTTWAEYLCMITGRTWTHLSHAAIPDGEAE